MRYLSVVTVLHKHWFTQRALVYTKTPGLGSNADWFQKQFQILKNCAEKEMKTMKEEARALQVLHFFFLM